MPTATLYPIHDGRIQKANSNVWSTTHDATDGGSVSTSDIGFQVDKSGTNYAIDRAYMIFDASSLAGKTITDVTLSILTTVDVFCNSPSSVAYAYGAVVGFTPASPTAVAVGDFDQFGTTALNNDHPYAIARSTTNTFALNSTGIALLNSQIASGYFKLGVRDYNFDLLNSAIPNTKSCYCFWNGSETANDPVLTITYTTTTPAHISGSSDAAASGSLTLSTPTPVTVSPAASNAVASGSLGINVNSQLPLNQSNATASGSLDLTTTQAVGSRAAPGWLGLFVTDSSAASVPLIAGGSNAAATGSLVLLVPSPSLISGSSNATAAGTLILRSSTETRIATPTSLSSAQFGNSTLESAQFGNSLFESAVDYPVS